MRICCPKCQSILVQRKGFFRQKISRKYVQRYWCKNCQTKFSASTLTCSYRQKKPFLNRTIFLNLCSGLSLRRTAANLGVSYNLVYSRFLWLSQLAEQKQVQFLKQLSKTSELQLDEMESIEHTKLKPLTIPLLVDDQQRILGVACGCLPAKGYLAEISRKKYGIRSNQSEALIKELLQALPANITPLMIKSDGKPSYRALIKQRFPGSIHQTCVRKDPKTREQLYLNLEKKRFDPMFALNQRCAKLRADINRLIRRSWSTTKKIENLKKHLMIYVCYNNQIDILSSK
ncbi:MAG: hypothetical protein LW875_11085 [Proteobacteria bacterium]|jgi:transposase-like protein|nr:hypothetical protein [Pseudomonadota bacterium]